MSFTIQQRMSGSVEVLQLVGRLVLGEGTSGLRDAMHAAVQRKADVLIDLSGVSYIDSAGLGELMAGYTSVTSQGQKMKLLRPAERVDSLLHLTRLYSTFEVFENEADALASFAAAK